MRHLTALLMGIILVGCGTTTKTGTGKSGVTVKIPSGTDVVKVDVEGITYLNGKQMSVYSLSDNFKKKKVVIDAHQYTPAAKIATIMNETTEAGITDVRMLSDMIKEKEREMAMKRMEARKKEMDEQARKAAEEKATALKEAEEAAKKAAEEAAEKAAEEEKK